MNLIKVKVNYTAIIEGYHYEEALGWIGVDDIASVNYVGIKSGEKYINLVHALNEEGKRTFSSKVDARNDNGYSMDLVVENSFVVSYLDKNKENEKPLTKEILMEFLSCEDKKLTLKLGQDLKETSQYKDMSVSFTIDGEDEIKITENVGATTWY